ncbi:VOC family protein [uncultured Jatrophihabitans sp.]|uniref:VOC family protein n=1 Tax=uncultured Jatrophihabitans sp. TaxID=1610747 RepID=UPI0035CBBD74
MLDHLVLATPDLAGTVADFADRAGVTPVAGGSHTGLGTANALVGLGPDSYLEIVGPDPDQPTPDTARPFGIDELDGPRVVTWAVHPEDVDATIERARRHGYDPGDAVPMSRRTPAGEQLTWRLTPSRGLVPFLIDWGATPHPASRALPTVELTTLALLHPDPAAVQASLDALQVLLLVEQGPDPVVVVVLGTPRGTLVL